MHTRFLLALQHLTKVGFPKVGVKTIRQIYDLLPTNLNGHILTEEEAAEQVQVAYEKVRRIPRKPLLVPLDKPGFIRALERADEILTKCASQEVAVIGCDENTYPPRLLNLADRPLIIYAKGNLTALQPQRAVAFVGTREPSEPGQKAGYRLATLLTEAGLTIVSGLALGCDTIGHRACLDAGGQTVAVMAGGLDHIYPKDNKLLATEILDKGGCLLAEHPVGVRPLGTFFVERDRLQSGLADGVVVLETDVKGGTMHTVGFAEKQGRLLACFRHPSISAAHPKAQGNQLLLRERRALPLGNSDEIATFLKSLSPISGHIAPALNSRPDHLTLF